MEESVHSLGGTGRTHKILLGDQSWPKLKSGLQITKLYNTVYRISGAPNY